MATATITVSSGRLECPEGRVVGGRHANGSVALHTAGKPSGEQPSEDRLAVLALDDRRLVLAVADGASGHASGGDAAELALAVLEESLRDPARAGDVLAALVDGFQRANDAVLDLKTGAATTLLAAVVEGRTVQVVHVGDSTALLVGQRGRIRQQTMAHSPVGYAVEAGVLSEADAILHDERHVVSNMVGTVDMRIEIDAPLDLAVYDTLVLASDGLWDNLHLGEVVERIRKGPLADAVTRLAEDATRRMAAPVAGEPSKPDDLTIVVFRRGKPRG